MPTILKAWAGNEHRRLVEPFVGGLAVTLGLAPRTAVLNDVNYNLIAFYKWLQAGLNPEETGVTLVNDRDIYAANRNRFNQLIADGFSDSKEAAVLFYYLNRTCFNGLCRFNASGFFNVPFGSYKTINYRLFADFLPYREVLKPYEFRTGDFEKLKLRNGDFVYADPPYDTPFTQYSAGGFSWDDQERLAKWLTRHKGPLFASNQATPRVLKLYRQLGFSVRTVAAPRRISCDGNREDAREMIAVKNL